MLKATNSHNPGVNLDYRNINWVNVMGRVKPTTLLKQYLTYARGVPETETGGLLCRELRRSDLRRKFPRH